MSPNVSLRSSGCPSEHLSGVLLSLPPWSYPSEVAPVPQMSLQAEFVVPWRCPFNNPSRMEGVPDSVPLRGRLSRLLSLPCPCPSRASLKPFGICRVVPEFVPPLESVCPCYVFSLVSHSLKVSFKTVPELVPPRVTASLLSVCRSSVLLFTLLLPFCTSSSVILLPFHRLF